MKKIIKILMMCSITICLFIGVSLTVSAATSGNYTYTISNGEVTITDFNPSVSGSITIPSTIEGYAVTNIGDYAFYACRNLTSITIPNSVTNIGYAAFRSCDSLTDISIPNSVKTIETWAFSDCGNLANIIIPDSVTTIGNVAFSSTAYYEDESNWIDGALYNGKFLIEVDEDLTGTYYIKEGTRCIASEAFYWSDLTNVIIPDSVTTICNGSFYHCNRLQNITVDEDNLNYCDLDGVLFNKEKTTLIQYTMGKSETNYSIPSSVTTIGDYAFSYCSKLTSVTIPSSVTTIEYEAFYDCNGLLDIVIPNGTTKIGSRVFENCSSLKTISIPNSLTSIGDYAFSDCSSLTSVTIHGSVTNIGSATNIGNFVFYRCSSLTSIQLPGNVTSIGAAAFYGCNSLTSIDIPRSVTEIGHSAFSGCSKLTSIEIPIGVTKIQDNTFYNCNSLTTVVIPNNIKSIGDSAFESCNNLTSIKLPEKILSIGNSAFSYCSKLTNIIIPNSVTTIGDSAFDSCVGLTDITMPDGIRTINDRLFYNCDGLTNVTIPNNVTTIAKKAFYSCSNLTSIFIPNSITVIEDDAFYLSSNLETVYYGGNSSEFAKISIGLNNDAIKNAQKLYSLYVKIFDMQGNLLGEKKHYQDETLDLTSIIDEKSAYYLYYDNKKIDRYNVTSKITSDLVLYVDVFVPSPETISIIGRESANVGETITETVFFATNKDVNYMLCNIKYPDSLELKEIIPIDFMYAEEDSQKTENGFTTLSVYCQYANSGNVDKNKTIIPFELKFEIDKYTNVRNASIEILNTTEYGASSVTGFDNIENTSIEILPKLAENITISGANDISDTTTYTAIIIPDYTTNKNIEWSVSDANIATITQEGALKPVMNGQVIIYAKTLDGSNLVAEKLVNISAKAKLNTLSTSIGDWECVFYEDQREYTIYVPEDAVEIGVTATYDGEGVMRIGGTLTRSGTTRNIELTDDTTSILIERTGVGNNYIDSTYTLTVIKTKPFTKLTVSEDGKLFNVRAYLVDNDSKIILALYKDKRFITLYDDFATQGVTIPFTVTEDYDTAKVMVWENWDTLRPLCEVEEINR